MRLPRTTTLFATLSVLILLLTALTVAPGVDFSEGTSLSESIGILALVAVVVLTLLLLRRMPKR